MKTILTLENRSTNSFLVFFGKCFSQPFLTVQRINCFLVRRSINSAVSVIPTQSKLCIFQCLHMAFLVNINTQTSSHNNHQSIHLLNAVCLDSGFPLSTVNQIPIIGICLRVKHILLNPTTVLGLGDMLKVKRGLRILLQYIIEKGNSVLPLTHDAIVFGLQTNTQTLLGITSTGIPTQNRQKILIFQRSEHIHHCTISVILYLVGFIQMLLKLFRNLLMIYTQITLSSFSRLESRFFNMLFNTH